MTTKRTTTSADPVPCWSAKACPFCGWVPNIEVYPIGAGYRSFRIACDYAPCSVGPHVTDTTRAKALRRWNKRSPIAPKVSR